MTATKIIAALAALAHEHRLAAYRLLVVAGPAGLSAGMVSERLGIPPSSLTFHLQQLLRAELVTQTRLSRQLIYAADFAAMNGLLAYLTENCCAASRQDYDASCRPANCAKTKPRVRRVGKAA